MTTVKDANLSMSASDLRKFEVTEMPFDNIRIGAFYETVIKGEEKNEEGAGLGYITY